MMNKAIQDKNALYRFFVLHGFSCKQGHKFQFIGLFKIKNVKLKIKVAAEAAF